MYIFECHSTLQLELHLNRVQATTAITGRSFFRALPLPNKNPTSTTVLPTHCSLTVLFILLLGHTAMAAPYVYVDANLSNTTVNGAPPVHGTNIIANGTTGSPTDNLWTYRTDSAAATYENANFLESDNATTTGDSETTADLVTTITLPTAGTYEFVVIFAQNNNRDVAARIGASPTAANIFTAANSLTVNQTNNPQIVFDSSYSNSRGASHGAGYLGQVTTTSDGESVSIYINGLSSSTANIDQRTQYDGIGYRVYEEPPPPVPIHRDVFLIAGQSNADGRGTNANLTGDLSTYAGQQAGVLIHYTNPAYTHSDKSRYQKWVTLQPGYSVAPHSTGPLPRTSFGVEIGAGKALAKSFPNPAFIKVTRGGTKLCDPGRDWYPAPLDSPNAGPLYKALITSTRQALAAITAAGETYTVHGLFWHQGESDSNRIPEYSTLLPILIESVRRDLAMPNLRFLIGELADTKPLAFRSMQWNASRNIPNAGFISSSGLATGDGTHFTTRAMTVFGERLGDALRPDRQVINFERPIYATGSLDRQDECAASNANLWVVSTAAQGEYTAGQAAGHTGVSATYFFTRRNALPLASARSMQADFFPGDAGYDNNGVADSSLLVAGWGTDAGNDGLFTEAETAIGLGLNLNGNFRIQIGGTTHLSTGFNYQIDRWYRLTLTWSEPDAAGNRTIILLARDLSTGTDLNGGQPILILENITPAEFDGNPARWSGLGCRVTRGLVDNIRIIPSGLAAWNTLYPSLTGGPADDDDNDGIANLIEFAFGLNPLSPDPSSALPQPVFGPTSASVSFAPLATQPGLIYQVDWSSNLMDWNTMNGTRNGSQLQFTIPSEHKPKLFIRHRVTMTP